MVDKPNSFHTLGLELNSHSLKGVQVNQRKGKPTLGRLFEIPLTGDTSLYLTEEGQALSGALQKNLVVTSLPANEVLVRQLEVKLKKESDIDDVLAFQTEPLLPYPVDQALVDRIPFAETPEGTQLTVLAARKDHIQHHLDQWHTLEVTPEMISCSPVALTEFAKLFAPSEAPQFILHLGSHLTTCLLVKGGKLIGAQACHQGVHNLEAAYLQDQSEGNVATLRQWDFAAFDHETFPTVHLALESFRLEVMRTLYALAKLAKGQEVGTILVTGDGGSLPHLAETLCQPLDKPLITPASVEGFPLSVAQLQRFAIPLGAALTALPSTKHPIDFRQQEFAYPNPWKRYKTPLAIYLGLCVGAALAFLFLSHAAFKYQEDGLRKEYSSLLQFMHRPYTAFEEEFTAKTTGKPASETSGVTPILSLSADDIMARLQYLQKDLQSTPDIYPLLPNVPTVSDVLAWLSTHPNVTTKDPKTGTLRPLLQIEMFNYTLAKRPEQTKKQEKYQVKVEIEFSSPTPKTAREFHDALISPNSLVDPKGEVKWSTNRGLYRASFFLKDKTIYPMSSG